MSVLDPRGSWIAFLVIAGLSLTVAFTALEPASSRPLDFLPRLVFWGMHNFAALLLLSVAQLAITRTQSLGAAPPFFQVALAGLLGAVLFTPVALGLDSFFASLGMAVVDNSSLLDNLAQEFAALAPPVWVLWLLLNAPRLVHLRHHAEPAAPAAGEPTTGRREQPPAAPPSDPPDDDSLRVFWERVPARLGRDIVALTAELHYLRVYTTRGDALILMAFGRAVEALAAQRGVQIHRSHWVALAHVVDLEQMDGKTFCVLDTGLRLPVSRANRAAFREALGTATPGV